MRRFLTGSCFWLLGLIIFAVHAHASASSGQRDIQIYAHRGARSFAPENTIPGYETALKIGTDWVDMDVVLSKDGQVVISHDPLLNPDIVRRADGQSLAVNKTALKTFSTPELAEYIRQYAVKNLTFKELSLFDVGKLNPASDYAKFFPAQVAVPGTKMPLLSHVIKYVNHETRAQVGFQIEMKTDPTQPSYSVEPKVFALALYKVLKGENVIGRSEIQAFDFRCLSEMQKLDSHVKTAYLTSRDNEKGGSEDFFSANPEVASRWTGISNTKTFAPSIPKMVKALGGYAWEPEDAALTEANLKDARTLGLKVVVWTWPEKAGSAFDTKMVSKMIDWQVDGIITDDPGTLISMLAARKRRVPNRYLVKPFPAEGD